MKKFLAVLGVAVLTLGTLTPVTSAKPSSTQTKHCEEEWEAQTSPNMIVNTKSIAENCVKSKAYLFSSGTQMPFKLKKESIAGCMIKAQNVMTDFNKSVAGSLFLSEGEGLSFISIGGHINDFQTKKPYPVVVEVSCDNTTIRGFSKAKGVDITLDLIKQALEK
jgi:hypothetical protein